MAASRFLALLCLGLTLLVTEVTSQRRCSVPDWPPELGPDPVAARRGKVTLVALFAGYCSYCVGQAGRLNELRDHLISQGLTDISFVIINNGVEISRQNIRNLQDAGTIPVIQDREDQIMFNQIFNGGKDDFIIYDRCGQRVAFIPHPYSYLGHSITERILRAVYSGLYTACTCNPASRDPHDMMYGDQPMGPSYQAIGADQELDLNCPDSDRWCRRYQRNFRRFHWDAQSGRHGDSVTRHRLSNRPRLRPNHEQQDVQGHHGHHRGRGHGGHGGHEGHMGGRHRVEGYNMGNHHRYGGGLRSRFDGTM